MSATQSHRHSTPAKRHTFPPPFTDLAAQARFQVAVITASDQKAKAISKALQSAECQGAIQVRLVVIPKLSFLLLRTL